jgi:hypothetical protein
MLFFYLITKFIFYFFLNLVSEYIYTPRIAQFTFYFLPEENIARSKTATIEVPTNVADQYSQRFANTPETKA